MIWKSATIVLVALGISLNAMAGAKAQDVAAGKALAERWCSACHVIDRSQRHVPNDAIPSFPAIAAMPSTTRISLSAFLSSSHEPMPNLVLSRKEIADVSAYILSLREEH